MAEPAWKIWSAVALSAVAIAMTGRTLLTMLHPARAATPSSWTAPPAPTGELPETARHDNTDSALTRWENTWRRDPFSMTVSARHADGRTSDAQQRLRAPSSPVAGTSPRLAAVAWGRSRLALLDGKVVGIGDTLPQGTIADIDSRGVLVEKDGHRTILRFPEGRTH